jgi:hypothetical protein
MTQFWRLRERILRHPETRVCSRFSANDDAVTQFSLIVRSGKNIEEGVCVFSGACIFVRLRYLRRCVIRIYKGR